MSVVEKPMRQMRGRLKSALAKRRVATRFPGESPRLLRHKLQALRKRARRWRDEGEGLAAASAATTEPPVSLMAMPEVALASAADGVSFEAEFSSGGAEVETTCEAPAAPADPTPLEDPASTGEAMPWETLQSPLALDYESAAAVPEDGALTSMPMAAEPEEEIAASEPGGDIEGGSIAAHAVAEAPTLATGNLAAVEAVAALADADVAPEAQPSQMVEPWTVGCGSDGEDDGPTTEVAATAQEMEVSEQALPLGEGESAAAGEAAIALSDIASATASDDANPVAPMEPSRDAEAPGDVAFSGAEESIPTIQDATPAEDMAASEAERGHEIQGEDIAASATVEALIAIIGIAPAADVVETSADANPVPTAEPSREVEAPSVVALPDAEESIPPVQDIAATEEIISAEPEQERDTKGGDIAAPSIGEAAIAASGIAPAEELMAASGDADPVSEALPSWAAEHSGVALGPEGEGDSAAVETVAQAEEINPPAQASPWRAVDREDMASLAVAGSPSAPGAFTAGAAFAAHAAASVEAAPAIPAPANRTSVAEALRIAGIGLLFFLALPYFLIPFYRFIDPPFSAVMVQQLLTGTIPHQRWVDLEDISQALPRAVVIAEDGAFCRHWGVDWRSVGDVLDDVGNGDGLKRGASTIPMQTAKNLFLWNGFGFLRKPLEVPLAYYMSIVWPKRRVMEVYLNIAEWGPGIFGAEAAARHHFGKPASQLTSREAALLAAALPNPIRRKAGRPNGRTARIAAHIQARVSREGQDAACVLSR